MYLLSLLAAVVCGRFIEKKFLKAISAVSADDVKEDPFLATRVFYNVSVMVSTDYPAIFAIFAGLVIALVLVGLLFCCLLVIL